MRMLTIDAASPQSALELHHALAAFEAEVVDGVDGRLSVRVPLDHRRQLSAVLRAIHRYVAEGECTPALIDLDGASYVLHAD